MKLVFLGDSITNHEHGNDWAKEVADLVGADYENFAVSAGNNLVQCVHLEQYLLGTDHSPDDVFVWILSNMERFNTLVPPAKSILAYDGARTTSSVLHTVATDFGDRLFLRCHPEADHIRKHYDPLGLQSDEALVQQRVLALIKLVSRTNPFLVALGWENTLNPNHREQFLRHLAATDAVFVREPVLEWCVHNGKEIADGGMHPTRDSNLAWAEENLIPEIVKIKGF